MNKQNSSGKNNGWIKNIAAAALFAAIVGAVVLGMRFTNWRDAHLANLDAQASIQSTALGDVQYQASGAGPAVLVLHGTPGGFDQVANTPSVLPAATRKLAVSRPGYLKTPLSSGKTPEQQADLFAQLLTELGESKAIVLAVSGGGPAGLQFALRHPQRTQALILLSGRTRSHPNNSNADGEQEADDVKTICDVG